MNPPKFAQVSKEGEVWRGADAVNQFAEYLRKNPGKKPEFVIASGAGDATAIQLSSVFDEQNGRPYNFNMDSRNSTVGILRESNGTFDYVDIKNEHQLAEGYRSDEAFALRAPRLGKEIMPLLDAVQEKIEKGLLQTQPANLQQRESGSPNLLTEINDMLGSKEIKLSVKSTPVKKNSVAEGAITKSVRTPKPTKDIQTPAPTPVKGEPTLVEVGQPQPEIPGVSRQLNFDQEHELSQVTSRPTIKQENKEATKGRTMSNDTKDVKMIESNSGDEKRYNKLTEKTYKGERNQDLPDVLVAKGEGKNKTFIALDDGFQDDGNSTILIKYKGKSEESYKTPSGLKYLLRDKPGEYERTMTDLGLKPDTGANFGRDGNNNLQKLKDSSWQTPNGTTYNTKLNFENPERVNVSGPQALVRNADGKTFTGLYADEINQRTMDDLVADMGEGNVFYKTKGKGYRNATGPEVSVRKTAFTALEKAAGRKIDERRTDIPPVVFGAGPNSFLTRENYDKKRSDSPELNLPAANSEDAVRLVQAYNGRGYQTMETFQKVNGDEIYSKVAESLKISEKVSAKAQAVTPKILVVRNNGNLEGTNLALADTTNFPEARSFIQKPNSGKNGQLNINSNGTGNYYDPPTFARIVGKDDPGALNRRWKEARADFKAQNNKSLENDSAHAERANADMNKPMPMKRAGFDRLDERARKRTARGIAG